MLHVYPIFQRLTDLMLDTLYLLIALLSFGAAVAVCGKLKNAKFDATTESYVEGCAKMP